MKTRQKQILICLIEDYIDTARPVSSAALAEKFDLSPATLRLELADLMRQGYLLRPHISSGRVPTDKAYRFYVSSLNEANQLSPVEKDFLKKRLRQFKEMHQIMQAAVQAISELSHHLTLNFLENDFFESGLSHLFQEPEFSDHDLILSVSQFFDMANQMMANLWRSLEGETTVFIGQENPLDRLPECSLLTRRYQLPTGQQGLVSILGPKRMNYPRNISLLEYVSRLLSA